MSMATLLNLRLPAHPVNDAVDEIIAKASSLTDLDGGPLFTRFERGGDLLKPPTEREPLTGRIWHDSLSGQNDTIQMFVNRWVVSVSIYCYFVLQGADVEQRGFQEQREAFCRYVITQLENPDLNAGGLDTGTQWRFMPGPVDIDHTAPFKRFTEYVLVRPPLYVSRIDFKIEVFDIERSNGTPG